MDGDSDPIYRLPEDAFLHIFSLLPLRQILVCRSVSRFFYQLIASPSFTHLIASTSASLRLIALRHPPHHHHHRHGHVSRHASTQPSLVHAFDPCEDRWLKFSLGFLPFRSLHAVAASSLGLVYLWGDSIDSPGPTRSLIACNLLTQQYKVLNQ